MKQVNKILVASALLACTACASTKTQQPEQQVVVYAPNQLGEMPQDEPPVEMAIVEELPPPPDADQFTTTPLSEQRAAALADTTVYLSSKLEIAPYLFHDGQNLAFYLEEQVNKAKTASGVKEKGNVTIRVVVERDGSLTNPVILESGSEILTRHSLAILQKMPKWRPGSLNGWERRAYATLYFTW